MPSSAYRKLSEAFDVVHEASGFSYRATLTSDGFIDQTNLQTNVTRPLRPALCEAHAVKTKGLPKQATYKN